MQAKLLDDQGRECAEPGQVGELVYRGPNVFAGYYRRPDLAAGSFTSDGFFRTGDFFIVRDDQHIGFVDRENDIVIRGGFNISAAEVENLVLAHPGVQEEVQLKAAGVSQLRRSARGVTRPVRAPSLSQRIT